MTEGGFTPHGLVAKLLTDDELVINLGSSEGIKRGMVFDVLDQETEDIQDPVTYKSLGSVERIKARVRVTDVGEHASIAMVTPRRSVPISIVSQVMMGQSPPAYSTKLSGSTWPDGVRVKDPVRFSPPPKNVE